MPTAIVDVGSAATSAGQDAQTALLTTIDADTSNLADAVATTDAVASGSAKGVPGLFVRDDALSSITPAEGDWAPGRISADGAVYVALAYAIALDAQSGVGADTSHNVGLGTAVATIKNAAGTLYGYTFSNGGTATAYAKLYDHASPTVGSTTPKRTIAIPAGSTGHISIPYGVKFGNAIKVAATAGQADSSTVAPGATDVVFEADYK